MLVSGYITEPDSWTNFRLAVRNGTISNFATVGDLYTADINGVDMLYQLVDIGSSAKNTTELGCAPEDPDYFSKYPDAKPCTFAQYYTKTVGNWSEPQPTYQITTAIASGESCNISLFNMDNIQTNYDFTAPQELKKDGFLRKNSETQLQYYATNKSSPVNITMAAGSANASISGKLSVANYHKMVASGDPNYNRSAIRQFINSTGLKNTYWAPQSIYDLQPSYVTTENGYMYGIDAELLSVIGKTVRQFEWNTAIEGSSGDSNFSDKFFIPSQKEVLDSATSYNTTHKGRVFDYYNGKPNDTRIKYNFENQATPSSWIIRSPHNSYSYNRGNRMIDSVGGSTFSQANQGSRVAPCFVIL